MKRVAIGLLLCGLLAQRAYSGEIDSTALKQLQGEWVVEEWTGYKLLGLYKAPIAPGEGKDYIGSRLTVSGTNTTWALKKPEKMEELALGLFSKGEDLTVKKEGDISFYTDRATIVELKSGTPGKLRLAAVSGENAKARVYNAIWELSENRLVVCKAKSAGAECSATLDIPADDFFNTRIVLHRVEKAK